MKWRVERCGSRASYATGWIAMDPERNRGGVFATHAEAVAFADRQARLRVINDGRRALMKLASRGVPSAGMPLAEVEAPPLRSTGRRAYRRVTDGELRAARAMRENGRTWREVASTLGLKESSIYMAARREGIA